MTEYTVVFTPQAEEQLAELYHYIAERTSTDSARRYTTGILSMMWLRKHLTLIVIKGRSDSMNNPRKLA